MTNSSKNQGIKSNFTPIYKNLSETNKKLLKTAEILKNTNLNLENAKKKMKSVVHPHESIKIKTKSSKQNFRSKSKIEFFV